MGATLAHNGKPAPPDERVWGTAATVTAAILGGAHIVRVHDVSEMVQVARVTDRILEGGRADSASENAAGKAREARQTRGN